MGSGARCCVSPPTTRHKPRTTYVSLPFTFFAAFAAPVARSSCAVVQRPLGHKPYATRVFISFTFFLRLREGLRYTRASIGERSLVRVASDFPASLQMAPQDISLRDPLAHLTEDGRGHGLRQHLEGVGALARTFAEAFNSGEWGFLAGLWHDLGNYAADFQAYIRKPNKSEAQQAHIETVRGRVDHSTAGAILLRRIKAPARCPARRRLAIRHHRRCGALPRSGGPPPHTTSMPRQFCLPELSNLSGRDTGRTLSRALGVHERGSHVGP